MSETPNTITAIKKELLMRLGHDADIFALISLCTREPYVVCDEETFDDEVFLFLDEEEAKKEAAKLAVQQEEERQRILNSTTYVWDEVSTPTYGQSYASITCDEIGLSSRLYWGDDQSMINTAQGVYEYTGASQIGYPGCHLLAAHNSSVFSLLQYASVGDIFTVTTEYGRYAYEVDSCRSGNVTADAGTIVAGDGTVLVNLGDSDDRLYMYTCYPFGYYGATNQRYVVMATLIPESETINLSALSTDDDDYMSINGE